MSDSKDLRWTVLSSGAGMVSALATRKLIARGWSAASRKDVDPPLNPADRSVAWTDALFWAVAAGVGSSVARVIALRAAAAGWEARTGSTPPGVTA